MADLRGDPETELAFSQLKIAENFSNYSAYQHRSVYLQRVRRPRDVVEAELAVTESAVYTEPDDQSSWWYRRFLFAWAEDYGGDTDWFHGIVQRQIEVLRGLLELEPESKWTLLELTALLAKERWGDVNGNGEERGRVWKTLSEVDPLHRHRYLAELATV